MTTVKELFNLHSPKNCTQYLIKNYGLTPDEAHEGLDTVMCGVEIEVENVRDHCNHLHGDSFSVKEDHSLRNYGREITTYPINSPLMVPAVRKILENLPEEHEFTLRTSIHFHLNVLNLTSAEVMGILYTYILFEKSLFRFVHPSRESSIFCVPIQNTDLHISAGSSLDSLYYAWQKYTAINLKTLGEFGTIEFRHLEGTDDIQKISNWFYLIMSIYQFGSLHPKDIVQRISSLNTTSEYFQFAYKVFGPWLECLDRDNLIYDMIEGVKTVKETVRVTEISKTLGRDSLLYKKCFPKKSVFDDIKKLAENVQVFQWQATPFHPNEQEVEQ